MPSPITPEDVAAGEDIDFEEKEEHWNVYKLKDGTTLKIKLILVGIKRLKKHGPDGTPLYMINSQNVVRAVDIPKELIAKQKEPSFKPV
ncbi:hypothetical protein MUO56_04380 [Candidatus Bathyarchaeota archaeon]|nr:hypothetical protein [Candidatus Bathyarchaeota archaeon]